MRTRQWLPFATLSACVLLMVALITAPSSVEGQDQGQTREFKVVGDHYTFSPSIIEANRGDVVKITFTAQDIAHSFTIDTPYRISKRAAAGQTVSFEFRVDAPGRHSFYCNLSADPKCKDMKGMLIVR